MRIKPATPLGLAFVFAVLLAGWASAANGLQSSPNPAGALASPTAKQLHGKAASSSSAHTTSQKGTGNSTTQSARDTPRRARASRSTEVPRLTRDDPRAPSPSSGRFPFGLFVIRVSPKEKEGSSHADGQVDGVRPQDSGAGFRLPRRYHQA